MVYRYTEAELNLLQKRSGARLDQFQLNSGRGLPAETLTVMQQARGLKLDENGEPVPEPLPRLKKRGKKPTNKVDSFPTLEAEVAQELEGGKAPLSKTRRAIAPMNAELPGDKRMRKARERGELLKKLPIPKEEAECVSLWAWAQLERFNRRPISEVLILIPNGAFLGGKDAKARAVVARKLKEQGFQPGVYDYIIPVPSKDWTGMWLEMKRTRGGVESSDQKAFARRMKAYGWYCVVAKGWVEASRAIEQYLALCPH
jgi:hypothetical protein